MKAAIYARKSNDDNDRSAENKSVTRQIEHAKAYAARKGWTVEEELVFSDDGISGAEYVNRPGFARLVASLKQFDVLVMSEPSRLGRDMTRNAAYVVNIIESGKRIFYYLTDEEEKADTPEQKIMLTLRSYASEVERLKAGQRSRDALERKAKAGFNSGGVVFGYDNVPVYVNGGETKSHTDYRINEEQADVVRRIFRMYAAGHGNVTVAKTLNGEPRYADLSKRYFSGKRPASPRKGTGSWAPSSVRALLLNERYCGKIPFGRTRKAYKGGTKTRITQRENVYAADRPDLRIVDEALWKQVQDRLAAVRKTYIRDTNGNLWGRPGMGVESKYLLTGLARCSLCGANMKATSRRFGSPGKRNLIHYYECSYWSNRGSKVCSNNHRVHMSEVDTSVLDAVESSILTPKAIEFVVDMAVKLVAERRRSSGPDRTEQLQREIRKQRKALDNFLRLIAEGKAPAAVLVEIRRLEAAIAEKEAELAGLAVEVPSELDLRRLKKAACERMGRFKDWIRSDVPVARQALRKLLADPIQFVPKINGVKSYVLRGATQVGPLFPVDLGVASPRGFEPRLPP